MASGPQRAQQSTNQIAVGNQANQAPNLGMSDVVAVNSNQINDQINNVVASTESQILPLLLSRPSSLTPNSSDPNDQSDQEIIEQVISLEVDYNSETTGIMTGGDVLSNTGAVNSNNQFTSSSEDIYNLLLEDLDRSVTTTAPGPQVVTSNHQIQEPDERMRIENIRKQLMSCEVQSEQSNMSPLCSINVTPLQTCQPQQTVNQQSAPQPPQQTQHQTHIATSQAPVIIHHQHQMSAVPPQMPNESLMQASYSTISNVPTGIPVSSGQSYVPPQHIARMSPQPSGIIVSNSWQPQQQQQQQLHNFQQPMRQPQQQHAIQQQSQQQMHQQQPHSNHQQHTSPQLSLSQQQQMHHQMQRSPLETQHPASPVTESPVVAKNPMLNAHLAKPPTRFMGNILNQNPILNEQLSQVPYVTSTASSRIGAMNPQSRFVQTQSNFNFQPQQPQTQQMGLYGLETNHIYRNMNTPASVNMASSSSNTGGVVSPQTKAELRRKVHQQQPRNQQTSLLKQLLSDNDNK